MLSIVQYLDIFDHQSFLDNAAETILILSFKYFVPDYKKTFSLSVKRV